MLSVCYSFHIPSIISTFFLFPFTKKYRIVKQVQLKIRVFWDITLQQLANSYTHDIYIPQDFNLQQYCCHNLTFCRAELVSFQVNQMSYMKIHQTC